MLCRFESASATIEGDAVIHAVAEAKTVWKCANVLYGTVDIALRKCKFFAYSLLRSIKIRDGPCIRYKLQISAPGDGRVI